MIQIVKNGNVAAILFTDSDFYLFNSGQIIVPLNSLSMVVDESDMATFRKASNNDLLFSAKISKITMGGTQLTKANAKTLFDSILAGPTGGGGFRFVSVETLPTTGENGVIYLVPEGDDSCEEYVWLADEQRYEKLGFETDLTGYVNSGNFETYLEESQGFGVLDTEVYMLSGDVNTLSGQVTANTASIATKQNARTQGTITKTQDNYTLDLSFEILLSAYTAGADVILQQGNNDRVFQLVKVGRDEMTFTYTSAEDGYIEGFTVTSADTLQHFVYDISTKLLDKQDTLTAGSGISINNNVISVTGSTPSSGYVTTEELEESELVTSAALNDLNTRVIEVSASTSAVTSLSGDVQTLSGNVQTLSGDVQSLSATVTGYSSDISTISGNVDTLSATVTGNSNDIATISGSLNTLSATVTGNSSNIATLSATVSGNSSDIVTLSGNVTSISGQIGDIATALSAIVGE